MTTELVKVLREKEPESIDFTVEGLAPWSMSKLKLLNQCPLSFYLKYIVKLKGPPAPPSLITEVGKAAHSILENIILGKSLEQSFKLVKKDFFPVISPEDWEQHVASLEFSIMDFRSRLDKFEKEHKVKRYLQELKLGVDKEFNPTGFFDKEVFFRGIIDLGIQTESGDVIIIDHKTGAPSTMGIRNFKTQLDTYNVLFHFGVENVEGAQSGIHFIRDAKVEFGDYIPGFDIENKLKNQLLFYLEGAIESTLDYGYFKHIRGPHCKWCDFNDVCKAGELTQVEKDTKKYFPIKVVTST